MKKFICLSAVLMQVLSNLNAEIMIPASIRFDKEIKPGVNKVKSEIIYFNNAKCLSTDKEYKLCYIFLNLDHKAIDISCFVASDTAGSGRLGAIIYLQDEQKKWKKVENLGWNKKLSANTFKNIKFNFTPNKKGLYLLILFRSNREGTVILKQIDLSYSDDRKNTCKINKISPQQIIVISENPDMKIRRAANELQKYIDMITGFAPRIVTVNKVGKYPEMKRIYIGANSTLKTTFDLKKCGEDGAWIKTDSQGNVFIAGKTTQGTEFGVYTFLQDYCGVRWYLPGNNGTYVPKKSQITIPENLNLLSTPRFISRMFSSPTFWNQNLCGEAARKMDMEWLRHNRLANNIRVTHAFYKILPPKKYFNEHPEYFPMINGKRFAPMHHNAQGWQPCMSNPNVIRICRDAAVKYFDENPDKIVFSLGPNDGNGYCLCDKCQQLNGEVFVNEQGFESRARQLFSFMNKIAESMPEKYQDKFLGTLAYHWTRNPGDFRLHPQVAPILCSNVDGNFNKANLEDFKLIKKLAANSKLVGVWAYLYGHNYEIPAFWPEIIEEYVDFLNPLNVKSWYSETYQVWGRDGFKYYILAQKLWNPAVRSSKLIDEFCTNMFDGGAAEMKLFFKICAERWRQQTGIAGPYTSVAGGAQFIVFTPEVCDKLIGLLQKAKQKCSNSKGKFLCDKFIMSINVTYNIAKLMAYELEIADAGITESPDVELLIKAMKQLKTLHKNTSLLNKDDFARVRGAVEPPRGGISFRIENIAAPILDSLYKFKLHKAAKQYFEDIKSDYPEYYNILLTAYNARSNSKNNPELIQNSNFKLIADDNKNAVGWVTGTWATKAAVSKSYIVPQKGKDGGNAYNFRGIKNAFQYSARPCLSSKQKISIEGSMRYAFSIRARFERTDGMCPIPWVRLYFYCRDGQKINNKDQTLGIVPGRNWFTSSWVIDAPANAYSMELVILATETIGEAWVDNISLKKLK